MKLQDELLATAIINLDFKEAQNLLSQGADPNALDKNGNPHLRSAIISKNLDIVQVLLDYDADPNAVGQDGRPIISRALIVESVDILKALLNKGADPNLKDRGIPTLLRAIWSENLDMVNALLEYGADPKELDVDKNPILLRAIDAGNLDIVKALLDHGADPLGLDKDKNPIFIQAVSNSSLDIVKLLLDCGADPNLLNKDGNSVIAIAVKDGIASKVGVLLKYGANPNVLDKDGTPIIFQAMMRESPSMLEAFLANEKTDIGIKDKDGNSALGVMLEIGRKLDMAPSLFIERATNKEEAIKEVVNLKNSKGETVLHLAAQQGNIEIFNKYLDYYLKSNQTVNILDNAGYTPLYWAKLLEHTKISDILTRRASENGNTAYTKVTKTESFKDLPPRPKIAESYNEDVGGVTAGNVKAKLVNQYSDVKYIDYRNIVPISANTEKKIDQKIISEAKKKAAEFLADKDALVIPGNSLAADPKVAEQFGGKVTVSEKSDFARSLAETIMVEVAIEKGMPIMGVCGGHQIVNAYLKGKITNLPTQDHKHDSIIVEPNSELASIIKKTNSSTRAPNQKVWASHSNIVQEIGGKNRIAGGKDLLKVVAKTDHEEIEATESQFGSPIRTFQFHPEMSYANSTYSVSIKEILRDKKIFESFVQSAETFASKRKLNTEIKSPRIQQLVKNIIEAKTNPKQLSKGSSSRG